MSTTAMYSPPSIRQTGILIGDEFRPSVSGRTFATVNPATEEVICEVAEGDAADVDLAVHAARAAFETGPWSRMDARDRGRLLTRLADLIEKNFDELAALGGRLTDAEVDRHRSVLDALGLPTGYAPGHWDELLAAMSIDKKARGSLLRFVVLQGIGNPVVWEGPDPALLAAAYASISAGAA